VIGVNHVIFLETFSKYYLEVERELKIIAEWISRPSSIH